MIKWRLVPWPLWVYSAGILVTSILFEIQAHGPIVPKALFPVLMFGWLYFLLKGVRWLWIFTVGIGVLGLVSYLISGPADWQGFAITMVNLLLLLLPATRRYFSGNVVAEGA